MALSLLQNSIYKLEMGTENIKLHKDVVSLDGFKFKFSEQTFCLKSNFQWSQRVIFYIQLF